MSRASPFHSRSVSPTHAACSHSGAEQPRLPTRPRTPSPSSRSSPRAPAFRFPLFAILLLGSIIILGVFMLLTRQSGNARLEAELISVLNDCLWPVDSVPTSGYADDFVAYIASGNDYISIENDSFTVNQPKPTLLCSLLRAGDSRPDHAGMVIALFLIAVFYIFVVCQRRKAQRLVPRVMQIMGESNDGMVALDDVRERLRRESAAGSMTWRFVIAAVNGTEGVNRVETKYSKPLWSAAEK